jgi:hypothetical protein
VPQGKLLGFIVSHRGIEANLENIIAITAMDAPRTIKDSSLEQIYLPTWRTGITLLQTAQAPRQVPVDRGGKADATRSQASFAVTPILTAPQPGKNLLLYTAATTYVVSSTIVLER